MRCIMKKRVIIALAGIFAVSAVLTGCEGSKGLETDELTITQYKGVEVDEVAKPEEITDEEVESTIESNLQLNAVTKEVTDRAVESGDTATIDFVGKIDGEEFEGGSSTDYPLVIGSGSFIDGFEDSIIGHEIGDTFDWDGQFPEDYGNADYAGKDVTFTITVNAISVDEVPELNDDFVKSVSDQSETVEEYKAEIKKQLEEDAENNYTDTLEQEVWDKVLENTEVKKYPEDEVEEMLDSLKEQYESAAEYYNTDFETFLSEQMGMTEEQFDEEARSAVEASVKENMVTEAIADKEKIEVSDDIYEAELKELAEMYDYEDVDALKESAEEEDLKNIVLSNLVKEWLADHCIQVAAE